MAFTLKPIAMKKPHFIVAKYMGFVFWDLQMADEELEKLIREGKASEIDLIRAGLQEAYLQGANLQGANLRGAKLEGANLQGANLEDGEGIETVLLNALVDDKTILVLSEQFGVVDNMIVRNLGGDGSDENLPKGITRPYIEAPYIRSTPKPEEIGLKHLKTDPVISNEQKSGKLSSETSEDVLNQQRYDGKNNYDAETTLNKGETTFDHQSDWLDESGDENFDGGYDLAVGSKELSVSAESRLAKASELLQKHNDRVHEEINADGTITFEGKNHSVMPDGSLVELSEIDQNNPTLKASPADRYKASGVVPVIGKIAKLRDSSNQDLVKLRDALLDFHGNDVKLDPTRNYPIKEFPLPQGELDTIIHVVNSTIELEKVTSFSEDLKAAIVGFWEYLKRTFAELEAFADKRSGLLALLGIAISSLGTLIAILTIG